MKLKLPIKEKEQQRVWEYLEQNATDKDLAKPLTALSRVLLDHFGWPATEGKKRARLVLEELAKAKKLYCWYDAKGALKSVRLVKKEVAGTANPAAVSVLTSVARKDRNRAQRKPGPEERRKQWAEELGDRNEARCYLLACRLVTVLRKLFPDLIVRADCTRSGRHDPENGKIDIADLNGEDVGILISAKLPNGSTHTGRIIIDAKSSRKKTLERNQDIYMGIYEMATGVVAKRAVAVNHCLHDAGIVKEMLAVIVAGGFYFIAAKQETILSAFRSY